MITEIYQLPFELQKKILYLAMEHPTSTIIKKVIKENNYFNNIRVNLDTKKIEPLSFYESLQDIGFFNKYVYRCPHCGDIFEDNFELIYHLLNFY